MKHIHLGDYNPDGVHCDEPDCHGYAARTDEDTPGYGCGRAGCCAAVYECLRCSTKVICTFSSPDMDFND